MAYPVGQSDPTKVVGRRVLAVFLDALLVIVPALLLVTASFEYIYVDDLDVSGEEFCDDYLDDVGGACFDAEEIDDRVYFSDDTNLSSTGLYWLSNVAILVVLQGLTGWTPGKLIAGIRVRSGDGGPPGIAKAALRWLLWIADGFPYVIPGLTGFLVALSTPGHRRIGDIVANTFVVRRDAVDIPLVVETGGQLIIGEQTTAAPLAWTPAPSTGAPTGWGPAVPPESAGWASPGEAPSDPTAPTTSATPPADGPQWDEARGTYIQWDPTQRTWMQWDEGFKAWTRIPGQ